MNPIETKEIKGLSLKALGWLIGSTVTIAAFVVSSYFLLKNDIARVDTKIDHVKTEKLSDDRYNDLKMEVLEADVEAIKVQIENLRNQVSTNRQTLEGIKQK